MGSGLQSRFFRALCPGRYPASLLGPASCSICLLSPCVSSRVCVYLLCCCLGWGTFNLPSYVVGETIFGVSCPVDSGQSKDRGFQPTLSLHPVPSLAAPGSHPGFCLTWVEKGAELGLVLLQGLGASQGNSSGFLSPGPTQGCVAS